MKKKVFRQLGRKIQKIEALHGDLEEFLVASTFEGGQHRLRMELSSAGKVYETMKEVYASLSDLELADLYDFQNLAGFNGDKFQAW